jgi:uncharacterized membrane protein
MCAAARAAKVGMHAQVRAISSQRGWFRMSDLIVIGFPDEDTAQNVWEELVRLEHDYLVDLDDAAIIRRDRKGKLHVTTPAHHAVAWGTASGLFWGVLIGLLFLFPLAPLVGAAGGLMGAALGAAGNIGLKDDFKQRVQDMVQPGTSAILVLVRKVTPDKFVEALRPYGGTVLRTSLPHDAEQELMKALHGDDPTASTWEQPAASAGTPA